MNTARMRKRFAGIFYRSSKTVWKTVAEQQYSDYFNQIAGLHAQGKAAPFIVLIELLEKYIIMAPKDGFFNVNFAFHLIELAKKLARVASVEKESDCFLTIIDKINKNSERLEGDELLPLLSAFFSIYEIYQANLSEEAKKKIILYPVWKNFLEHKLAVITSGALSRRELNRERGYQLLGEMAKSGLLTMLSESILKCVLRDVTRRGMKSPARVVMMAVRENIHADLNGLIIDKLQAMMRSNRKDDSYAACLLLRNFYLLFPTQSRDEVVQFLLKNMGDNFYYEAGQVLLAMANTLPEQVIITIKETLLNKIKAKTFDRYKALELLLRLREQVLEPQKQAITAALQDYLNGQDQSFRIERVKKSWEWFSESEKDTMIQLLFQARDSEDQQDKYKVLNNLVEIVPYWVPKEKHFFVFDFLLCCLQEEALKESAFQALDHVCLSIPVKKQAAFVAILLEWLGSHPTEKDCPVRTLCHVIASLSKLCQVISEKEKEDFIKKISLWLDSKNSAIETWACKAIAQSAMVLSQGECLAMTDKLIQKLQWNGEMEWNTAHIYTSDAANEAALALISIGNRLSTPSQQSVAMQLFAIVCDSLGALAGRQAAQKALESYIPCLDCHQKLAMLNSFSRLKSPLSNSMYFFSRLYQAYQADINQHHLGRILANVSTELDLSVPPELAVNIVRFLR